MHGLAQLERGGVVLADICELSGRSPCSRPAPAHAGSTLPLLVKALRTGIEELIGEPGKSGKRGPAPRLQQQL